MKEALKLALEALEYIRNIDTEVASQMKYGNAAQIIEEALAQQDQEPVACKTLCELCVKRGYTFCANAVKTTPIPTPPERKPLTKEQPAQQEPVTDEENEKFSRDVSNFKGTDEAATMYALEKFLKGRMAPQPAPVQEPVATLWQHGETGRTRITMPGDITDCDARWFKAADLYTSPPQPEERNFCPRCGKRTADLTVIHTCTPPQENT